MNSRHPIACQALERVFCFLFLAIPEVASLLKEFAEAASLEVLFCSDETVFSFFIFFILSGKGHGSFSITHR